ADPGTLAFAPATLGLAAHPGSGGNRQRARLQVAYDHAGREQIDMRRFVDIAFQLAGDRDLAGAHAARQFGAGLDSQVTLDADVAFEFSRDAHAAAALDLAFDRDVGGDQRFLRRRARVGAGHGRARAEWGPSGLLGLRGQ